MQQALQLAETALTCDEVPVAAIIVANKGIIAEAHNLTISHQNACAHAEMLALAEAFEKQNNYRLLDATMYVTLEPCCMCAGAVIHSRVKRVVFGAYDKRVGAAGSVFNILGDPRQYYHPEVIGGCLQQQSEQLLKRFFLHKRSPP